jgi:creatinine amidohydrolase
MAQILQMAELNTDQIPALDRSKTAILIPGGILEEHGPYLSSFTDGNADAAFTQGTGPRHRRPAGLDSGGIPTDSARVRRSQQHRRQVRFSRHYTVRMTTLRAVYMDLGSELGEQGFRWIFLIHNHGDPMNNRALDQASDFFHDVYGGNMVHLFGLPTVMQCCGTPENC